MDGRKGNNGLTVIAAACALLLLAACGDQDDAQATELPAGLSGERSAQVASNSLGAESEGNRGTVFVEQLESDEARNASLLSNIDVGVPPSIEPSLIEATGDAPAAPAAAPAPSPAPAPAPAPAPVPSTSAKPRVASLLLGGLWSAERRQAAARTNFTITSLSYGSSTTGQSWIDELRRVNPSIKLAAYTNMVDADLTPESDRSSYLIDQAAVANNWWLYTASGSKVQWTTAYDTHMINITRWGSKDASGRRYTEWVGDFVAASRSKYKGLDYVYLDNVWHTPRPYKGYHDFMRNGTDQYAMSPDIQAAWRLGTMDFVARLRSKLPGIKVIGNADNNLNYPEYSGKLDGSFYECAFGKSWSFFNRLGWERMMAEYRSQLANTISKQDTVFQGCGPNGLDLPMLRFGLASALLENGWFAYTVTGEAVPYWADEYDANLGTPSEAPPTAPTASGIWMRKYSNGIVLVNPGTTTASVNIGSGYKRLTGTKDPVTNNGLPISTVTLEPNRGLIVVKQ